MIFRTAYESVVIFAAIVVGWLFVIKPLCVLIFRRTLRTTVNVAAGDALQDSTDELVDEQVLSEAHVKATRAAALRAQRNLPQEDNP